MKKKNDFVTNSSSTSFIVWGTSMEQEDLLKNKKLVEQIYNKYKESKYFPDGLTLEEFNKDVFNKYSYEINDFFTSIDLESIVRDYSILIGSSPENMKDNQTLKEFKDDIILQLKNVGIEINKLGFIAESWYDG